MLCGQQADKQVQEAEGFQRLANAEQPKAGATVIKIIMMSTTATKNVPTYCCTQSICSFEAGKAISLALAIAAQAKPQPQKNIRKLNKAPNK